MCGAISYRFYHGFTQFVSIILCVKSKIRLHTKHPVLNETRDSTPLCPPPPAENSNDPRPAPEGDRPSDVVTLSGLLDSATLETSGAVSENLNLHAE